MWRINITLTEKPHTLYISYSKAQKSGATTENMFCADFHYKYKRCNWHEYS